MIWMELRLSQIAQRIIELWEGFSGPITTNEQLQDMAEFQLLCQAWKQRTGEEMTILTYKSIKSVYGA